MRHAQSAAYLSCIGVETQHVLAVLSKERLQPRLEHVGLASIFRWRSSYLWGRNSPIVTAARYNSAFQSAACLKNALTHRWFNRIRVISKSEFLRLQRGSTQLEFRDTRTTS